MGECKVFIKWASLIGIKTELSEVIGLLNKTYGLASVWAEFGPARYERARGRNSI